MAVELVVHSSRTVTDEAGTPGEDEDGYIFVNGKYAGQYHVVYWERGWFEIRWLGLEQEFRGRGYGRQAFDRLSQKAKTKGQTSAYLEVRDDSAEAFWKSVGFELIPSTAIMEKQALRHPGVYVRQHRRSG